MSKNNLFPLFRKKYNEEIRNLLKQRFGFTNDFAIPKIEKIVFNIGAGSKIPVKTALDILEIIAAQRAVITTAKKSVAMFKIREGNEIGAMVTCRGDRMYFALQRIYLALLNWRNFKFFKKGSINCRGNKCQLTVGIKDSTIFQGVSAGGTINNIGLSFTIVSNARTPEHFEALLKGFGFPFVEEVENVH